MQFFVSRETFLQCYRRGINSGNIFLLQGERKNDIIVSHETFWSGIMKRVWDILIVGGGASGLFAAIAAAKKAPHKSVLVVEREQRIGKKLLTTGNGRCNFTNQNGLDGRYFGDVRFAVAAFERFGVEETCRVMEELGISYVTLEEGKCYPRSLQAGSVVDMLRFAAADAGVEIMTETTVQSVAEGDPFTVRTDRGTLLARRVLVAVGGKSCLGKYDGPSGYELLTAFGHAVTKLTPAIVQVTTQKEPIKPLAGIKTDGVVTAIVGGEIRQEAGEILFAEYGVSGPPVLQISGLIGRHGGGELRLDLMPDCSAQQIITEVSARCKRFAHRTCEDLLTGFMNKRLGQTVLKRAGIEKLSRLCGSLTPQEIRRVAEMIKTFPLQATGTKGWNAAQVTCGGILTKDFDPKTMESRLHKNLYAAGEVLNVTGDCGGFNLQWAWTSGYLAGCAMGEEDQ